jgi:hypothetical protein
MRTDNYEHLSVSGQSLNFQGWGDGTFTCSSLAAQCDPLAAAPSPGYTQPLATVDGSNAARVLVITGNSHVSLRNIRITMAKPAAVMAAALPSPAQARWR